MPNKCARTERECYCCSLPATTVEHIPAQCFFPEKKDLAEDLDFRKELITVPSCETHNTKKSGDDEYLFYVIPMTLRANKHATHHFETKILRAINRRPALINHLLDKSRHAYVRDPIKLDDFVTVAISLDYDRIEKVLMLLARGLYYHHFETKYMNKVEIITEFLISMDDINSKAHNDSLAEMFKWAEQIFQNQTKFGTNPEIFFYQVVDAKPQAEKIFRVVFYEGVQIIFIFGEYLNQLVNTYRMTMFWYKPIYSPARLFSRHD
jgi:hypothetical protein